jgi:hypothetical protein
MTHFYPSSLNAQLIRQAALFSLAALVLAPVIEVNAQGSGLCPGLSGNARHQCLQAENRRAAQTAAAANRKAQNWDAIMKGACMGNSVGGAIISGQSKFLGKAVYSSAQSITYRAMGRENPCVKTVR